MTDEKLKLLFDNGFVFMKLNRSSDNQKFAPIYINRPEFDMQNLEQLKELIEERQYMAERTLAGGLN